jgi:hypothetical protein
VSPVKYKLGFHIQEDDVLHTHRRENLKSYNLSFDPLPNFEEIFSICSVAILNE